MRRTWLRRSSLLLIAGFFVAAGINHFRDPALYLAMMPAWLPGCPGRTRSTSSSARRSSPAAWACCRG